jgi:hypothetical protein
VATGYIDLLTLLRTTGTGGVAEVVRIVTGVPLDGNEGGLPEILFLSPADVRLHVRNITSQPVMPPV